MRKAVSAAAQKTKTDNDLMLKGSHDDRSDLGNEHYRHHDGQRWNLTDQFIIAPDVSVPRETARLLGRQASRCNENRERYLRRPTYPTTFAASPRPVAGIVCAYAHDR